MADSIPRRRSSRLHNRGATPSQNESTTSKLSSVVEREESPPQKLQNIDELLTNSITSSGINSGRHYPMPGAFDTPPPPRRIHPGMDEMHPSKVHQSTIRPSAAIATAPSNKSSTQLTGATPPKSRGSLPAHMSSPGFDFSFTRPESDLSEEAQKIMDSVREEAARIKAQMEAEREKQNTNEEGNTQQLFALGGRKIAKPRAGRYSDVHKQQFKKMDSIADHISTWKSKMQSTATAPTTSSSLKRSNSKAGFDVSGSVLPRSKSFKVQHYNSEEPGTSNGKRVKRTHDDDASQTRPMSRDTKESHEMPLVKAKSTALPIAISTPTKASLARSASVKSSKTSMIPSLSRSASTKTLGTPQTEGSNKYMSKLAKFSPVKSILHRSQPKFSDDPLKVAAGTHLPAPTKPLSLDKDLPKLPDTPLKSVQHSPSPKKHVNFTPSTKPIADITPLASPSPSKIPRSESMKAVSSPNSTHRNTHKIPTTTAPIAAPGLPSDFTFSSSKTINFGPPTSGLSAKSTTSTIRPVRPSGFPTPLAETAFENHKAEGIPHGIGNKKRKHAAEGESSSDIDENQENVDPGDDNGGVGSPSKRVKVDHAAVEGKTPVKKVMKAQTPKSKGKGVGRGIMSLGRLNALARPKGR
ncbi:MAG: hypothetical protein Q9222_002950 [Ikaeria aurantiellina]